MTDEANQPEKKIIVDEDWKKQVEAEREAAAQPAQPEPMQPEPAQAAPEQPMPPASLSYLAGTLYFQGAIALGLLPHPVSGKAEPSLGHAKHVIDTLEVLQQKTEGNRTPEESEEIETILHQLRLAYVEVKR